MITGFNNVSFTVVDLDIAVRFWTEVQGFEAASISARHGSWQEAVIGLPGARLRIAHLHGSGQHIEFIESRGGFGTASRRDPNMAGVAHLCLEVTDIAGAEARLLASGATPQGKMTRVDEGSGPGSMAGYIRDPNGIVIELLQPAEPGS